MQMGGVIYNDSADKAARFIMNCKSEENPLVFLQDVRFNGRHCAQRIFRYNKRRRKMVNAVANLE